MHDYKSERSQTTLQHAKSAHPLAGFDFRATVDRVRIQITLSRATQAHALRRHLPPEWYEPYVKGADQHPSHTDTRFAFWIQDPAGPDAIEAGLRSLPARFQPVVAVEVLAVEVAMDLYPIPDRATKPLPETVLYILRNYARPVAGQAKITWRERLPSGIEWPRYMAAAGVREVLGHLGSGHTIQTGEQNATDLFRAYVKTYDRTAEGSYVTLPVEEHRARYERCLSGDLVPFSSLAGWREFDFATLAKLFALRRETGEPESALLRVMMEQIVTRRAVDERKRAAHKRMTPRGTEADAESYERIRQALRRLTSEQRGVSRRRPVQLSVAGNVGISGSTTTAESGLTLGGAVVRAGSPKYIHPSIQRRDIDTDEPASLERPSENERGNYSPCESLPTLESIPSRCFPDNADGKGVEVTRQTLLPLAGGAKSQALDQALLPGPDPTHKAPSHVRPAFVQTLAGTGPRGVTAGSPHCTDKAGRTFKPMPSATTSQVPTSRSGVFPATDWRRAAATLCPVVPGVARSGSPDCRSSIVLTHGSIDGNRRMSTGWPSVPLDRSFSADCRGRLQPQRDFPIGSQRASLGNLQLQESRACHSIGN